MDLPNFAGLAHVRGAGVELRDNIMYVTDQDDEDSRQGIKNPVTRALMRQQLVLLLHARKCMCRDIQEPADWLCAVPNCGAMREILDHLMSCRASNCSQPNCSTSRQILNHWRNCINENCQLCLPLKMGKAKDWHYSLTVKQRNHLIELIVQKCPKTFLVTRAENEIYKMANSLEDYYRIMAAKMVDVQLDNKPLKLHRFVNNFRSRLNLEELD